MEEIRLIRRDTVIATMVTCLLFVLMGTVAGVFGHKPGGGAMAGLYIGMVWWLAGRTAARISVRPTGGRLWRIAWEIALVSCLTSIGLAAVFLILCRLVGGLAYPAPMTTIMKWPGLSTALMFVLAGSAISLCVIRGILWFHICRQFRDF